MINFLRSFFFGLGEPKEARLARWIYHEIFDASFPEPIVQVVNMAKKSDIPCNAFVLLDDNRDIPCIIYICKESAEDKELLLEVLTHELIHAELWYTEGCADHGFPFVKRTQEIYRDTGIWVQCPMDKELMTDKYSEVVK